METLNRHGGRVSNEQTNHRAVMTSESDAGGERAQAPLNRPLFSITSRPPPPPASTVFSPQVLEDVAPEANGQRKTEAPLTPRTLTRCVVFIPTTRYWNSFERAWTESELSRLLKPQYPRLCPTDIEIPVFFQIVVFPTAIHSHDCQLTWSYICVCVCINDKDLERRKWFRREITNYGFSNLNVIRSLLSFAQRELIYGDWLAMFAKNEDWIIIRG